MQYDDRRNVIKASVMRRFVRSGKDVRKDSKEGEKNLFLIGALSDDLVETEYKTDDILDAIKEDSYQSEWEPRLARIITILRSKEEKEQRKELDRRWQYFLAFGFNPYAKLEDWAYDLKITLGWEKIQKLNAKDLNWFQKDFDEYVKRQINGEVKVIGDNRKWVQIGNAMCLESTKPSAQETKQIGTILQKKEEEKIVCKFKISRYIQGLSGDEGNALKSEVEALVLKESFKPNIDKNSGFYEAMVKAKMEEVVAKRIAKEEANKPKLKVVA